MIIITNNQDIDISKYKIINIKQETRELLGIIIDLVNKFDTIDDILMHINTESFLIIDRITLNTIINTYSLQQRLSILRKSTIRYVIKKYRLSDTKYLLLLSKFEIDNYCPKNIDGVEIIIRNKKQKSNKIQLRR